MGVRTPNLNLYAPSTNPPESNWGGLVDGNWYTIDSLFIAGKLSIASIAATGTPSVTTFLRGDGTWAVPPTSGGGGSGNVLSVFGRTGTIVAANNDYSFSQIGGALAVNQINATGTASSSSFLRGDGTWAATPGGVSSVFGRTGAIVATSGDYSFAQISGTVASTQLPNPTNSTNGGVKSTNPSVNFWVSGINSSGTPTLAQPGFSNISGTLTVSQIGAAGTPSATTYLRGDGLWATPTTGSGGQTLQTNGITNGSQSLLNLQGGTNVTIADNGSGTVTISASTGTSAQVAISSNTALTTAYQSVWATGGVSGITATLPSAAANPGQKYLLKKMDAAAGVITIAVTGSDTIDGQSSSTLVNQYQYISLTSDGTTHWNVNGGN